MGSCEPDGPMYVLDWCASTAPPASTALPSRPLGPTGGGWGRVEEWPRPRPVPPPERLRRGGSYGAGAASITANSLTRKGLRVRRPVAGRRAGPTSWGLEGRGGPSCGLCPPLRPAARGTHFTHKRGCLPAAQPSTLSFLRLLTCNAFQIPHSRQRALASLNDAPPAWPKTRTTTIARNAACEFLT